MLRAFLTLLCTPLLLSAQTTTTTPAPSGPGSLPPPLPTLTGEQTATIMKQLEMLEGQVGKGRNEILAAALTKFKAAASSPSAPSARGSAPS